MRKSLFRKASMRPTNPRWKTCVARAEELYGRADDIRSAFARDYNRILHCTAYRRLKRKTQVFFAPKNDHICTRIEHVNHVTAVSYTIANYLGLNTELTNAIAIGHDLGHAPFGHAGEEFLAEIVKKELRETFWHERNSLWFADRIETLEDPKGDHKNLDLTYAVRDGIICHCGEVDENRIFPREDSVDLAQMTEPNQYSPFTWEGCVVKIADKIACLGRDIEDARTLKILTRSQVRELVKAVRPYTSRKLRELNTTVVMHDLIIDLCNNSSPEKGIALSDQTLELMNALKEFNCKNIYFHPRIKHYREYADLIIKSIYRTLKDFYRKEATIQELDRYSELYPTLVSVFKEWLQKYAYPVQDKPKEYRNFPLYDLKVMKMYKRSVVDFIAGMTDSFAIKVFNEITSF